MTALRIYIRFCLCQGSVIVNIIVQLSSRSVVAPCEEFTVLAEEKVGPNSSSRLATALSEAQAIIGAAEERAQGVRLQAEKAFEKARDEGYQAGLESGQKEVAQAALRLIGDEVALHKSLAQEAARLAITICAMLIEERVTTQPDTVERIAKKALRESMVGEVATLAIHSLDQPAILASLDSLQRITGGARINIETDDSITRGGCIVKTEFGEVDARIESLLEAVAQRLGVES